MHIYIHICLYDRPTYRQTDRHRFGNPTEVSSNAESSAKLPPLLVCSRFCPCAATPAPDSSVMTYIYPQGRDTHTQAHRHARTDRQTDRQTHTHLSM